MKKNTTQVPRETTLMNQPHRLAYINPFEEDLLRSIGGAGTPGPGGIPQFGIVDWAKDTWAEITSGGKAETATYNGAGSGSSSSSSSSSSSGSSSTPTSAQRPRARPETVTVMDSSSPSSTRDVSWNEYVDTTRSRGAAAAPETYVAPENNQGASALSVAMNEIRAQQDALAEKKGLAGLVSGMQNRQLENQYNMLANQGQYAPQQGMLQKALGYTLPGMALNALSSLRADPVSYNPVFDTQGNYLGVAGYDAEGNPVSYTGERTANISTGNDKLDAMVRPNVGPQLGGDSSSGPAEEEVVDEAVTEPEVMCPLGFIYDKDLKMCIMDPEANPIGADLPTMLPDLPSQYTQVMNMPTPVGLQPYAPSAGGLAATPSPNQAGIIQVAPTPMQPQQKAPLPNLVPPQR